MLVLPERFLELLAKKHTAELSAAELEELEQFAMQDAQLYRLYEKYLEVYTTPNPEEEAGLPDEGLLKRHQERLSKLYPEFAAHNLPRANSGISLRLMDAVRQYKWRIAAAVLLLLSGAVYFTIGSGTAKKMENLAPPLMHQVYTQPGNRSMLLLPDGTQVWVNANSKLSYDEGFGKSNRKLLLSGEAYFIAAKNKNLPLTIHTRQMIVSVVGTTFNVRDYENEAQSVTSLFEGAVNVVPIADTTNTYKLKPNQKLILQNQGAIAALQDSVKRPGQEVNLAAGANPQLPQITITGLQIDKADSSSYEAAWVNNTLAFSNESFADIALKMENWYGVDIEFANSGLESIRFTGKFTSESVTDALHALQFTARFSFKKNQQKILIY